MPSGHARAVVAGTTVAETDTYELVEGNVYFPPSSIRSEYFRSTNHRTYCPWKGQAHYYSILVKEGKPPFPHPMPTPLGKQQQQQPRVCPGSLADAMLRCGATGGDELKDAAWYYPDTKETAEHIKGYVAFYKSKVEITHS